MIKRIDLDANLIQPIGLLLKQAQSFDDLIEALKDLVLWERLRTPTKALECANLIVAIGEAVDRRSTIAIGRRMQAFIQLSVYADFSAAESLLDEAAAIHLAQNDKLGLALVDMNRVWILRGQGQTQRALVCGHQAAEALKQFDRPREVAGVLNNLAAIYGEIGNDAQALTLLDEAAYIYQKHNVSQFLAPLWINRAMVLRNLGRFTESIAQNQAAIDQIITSNMQSLRARANHTLGNTYFMLGLYNKALELHAVARQSYVSEQRAHDAILADLTLCNGLLKLGQFKQVVQLCEQIRATLLPILQFHAAELCHQHARGLMGQQRYAEALPLLTEAQQHYEQSSRNTFALECQLDLIRLHIAQHQLSEALTKLNEHFYVQSIRPRIALDSHLLGAELALIDADIGRAQQHIDVANRFLQAQTERRPETMFQVTHLQGRIAVRRSQNEAALDYFDSAIMQLEQIQCQMLSVFRPDFLKGRDQIYAEAVEHCLKQGWVKQALTYAEKGKSRLLLDLFSGCTTSQITARNPADQPLVAELNSLRQERDQLYRRWEADSLQNKSADKQPPQQPSIVKNEQRMVELWQQLLVRNATYEQDAPLWQPLVHLPQPHLDEQTVLIEYFAVGQQWVVFVITRQHMTAHTLPTLRYETQLDQASLDMLLNSVRYDDSPARHAKIKRFLERLYQQLIAPIRPMLTPFKQLLIVPHGSLHYFPFHALFDGQHYLGQQFKISYLPSSSLLHLLSLSATAPTKNALVIANSSRGQFPETVAEAKAVAQQLDATLWLEASATRTKFMAHAPQFDTLYIASHAQLQTENALFSGLSFADGWLTIFDLFNLRLNARRIILSGCETGRSIISGGDEVQGIVYSFLSAGAQQLHATLWPLPDRFDALRQIQIEAILSDDHTILPYHLNPFYWASFARFGRFSGIG